MPRLGRDLTRPALALAAALLASVAIAGPAAASTPEPGEACWLDGDTGEFSCYESEEAFAAELEERGIALVLREEPDSSARAASAVDVIGADPETATLAVNALARFYANANYGGASFTHTSSLSSCVDYSITVNLASDWNNRISSFQGYLGCRVRLWDGAGASGTSYGPYIAAATLGSFDNKASSYRVHD